MSVKTKYNWTIEKHGDVDIAYAGTLDSRSAIIDHLQSNPKPEVQKIIALLENEKLCFGLAINTPEYSFGLCDRVKSYSLYYNETTGDIFHTTPDSPQGETDPNSVLEFMMAGYVLGNRTLYNNYKQIRGGEFIYIDKRGGKPEITNTRYYRYRPTPFQTNKSEEDYRAEFGRIMDAAIKRSLDTIGDKPILIPLSGGLDSRIVLGKLHEHGARNIKTFSYGLPNNFEAKMAKKTAAKLDIEWRMVPSEPENARSLYNSQARKDYTQAMNGLCHIPSYVEFEAFHTLVRDNLYSKDSIIFNGQAGDYIAGNHIPKVLYDKDAPTVDDITRFALDKHFSLWENLKDAENEAQIEDTIKSLLLDPNKEREQKDNILRQYESFEWQERQCKMVTHAQKTYDFFEFDWRLPLWDKDIMDFFETLPWHLKFGRKLFRDYVQDWNYKGLFNEMSAEPEPWITNKNRIIWTARIIGLLKGSDAKNDYYKKMAFFNDSHWQYALFGKDLYDRHYKDMRNMISLAVLQYLQEHNIDIPKGFEG